MRRLTPHDAVVPSNVRWTSWSNPCGRASARGTKCSRARTARSPAAARRSPRPRARLAAIAELGFDVVYLPPIHPIGRTNRKGPNNTLTAGPDDPGSPWAIGSAEGGHMSVHPALGTLDDFDRFVATARRARPGRRARHRLPVLAGSSVRERPTRSGSAIVPTARSSTRRTRRRSTRTSIRSTSNARPGRRCGTSSPGVVLFWIEHGVRIFRVDNPHTKSFRFWQWMMADVRRQRSGRRSSCPRRSPVRR